MEILLLVWILVLATMWLARILAEELWWAVRGRAGDPPRVARRRARERVAREAGTPTVGQAVSSRLAKRIVNPPRRRWAVELRALVAELTADAVAEARVRHHVNRQARARRHAQSRGWRVRTGGPTRPAPPRPEPDPPPFDDTVTDTRPCSECRTALVVPPDEVCERCEHAAAPPPEPAPAHDPPPAPTGDEEPAHRKAPPMAQSVTHTIAADVHNPCVALQFSTDCRDFAHAVGGQFDLFGAAQRRLRIGDARIGAGNVLRDEIRGYESETEQSIEAYAKHERIKAQIESDPDLVETIDDTYLGGGTGDHRGVTPPKDVGVPAEINASDLRSPEDCARFMTNVAGVFGTLKRNADEVLNAHIDDGVAGKPIEFLEAQRDRTARIAAKAAAEARAYEGHASKRDDTIGSDPSLRNTQRGGYLSPTGA